MLVVQKLGIAPMGACYAHFNEYLNSAAITSEKRTEFILTSLGSDILSASSSPGGVRSVSSGNMNGWWSQSPCRSLSSSPSPISLCPISFQMLSHQTQVQTEFQIIPGLLQSPCLNPFITGAWSLITPCLRSCSTPSGTHNHTVEFGKH